MPDQIPISHSPQPPMAVGMSFPRAMEAVIDGKRVTRLEWANKNEFGELKDGFLMIHTTKDGKFHQWIVNDGDLTAHDWIVCEEPKKGVN